MAKEESAEMSITDTVILDWLIAKGWLVVGRSMWGQKRKQLECGGLSQSVPEDVDDVRAAVISLAGIDKANGRGNT